VKTYQQAGCSSDEKSRRWIVLSERDGFRSSRSDPISFPMRVARWHRVRKEEGSGASRE
jgi:hypothetical protein